MGKLLTTIADSLYWSYANLAMAHSAVSEGAETYTHVHFAVRSRLYAGLKNGTMQIGSFIDDERLKLILPQRCSYCGNDQHLSIDHLIPRYRGGKDTGDNMVWACRSCNSAKGATDVLVWFHNKEQFPPLLLLRRYLKIAIDYCAETNILDLPIEEAKNLPFALEAIPHEFPKPTELKLWIIPLNNEPG